MIRRPPRSTLSSSSAASDVYKRQKQQTQINFQQEQKQKQQQQQILFFKFKLRIIKLSFFLLFFIWLKLQFLQFINGKCKEKEQQHSRRDQIAKESVNQFSFNEGQFSFCLLYTSPSPRDRQKSRMPSSA
eukprot:TRINITY_DN5033_c0_g1_i4.p2 TRINITY_DN5033_c0_g1~~TRINITY_DN5033_c0_g1_i4.p2  ORF type:complete len:130 (+),score=21.21 TRINITY_DN5033_c0_g1_i4:85-474(+)